MAKQNLRPPEVTRTVTHEGAPAFQAPVLTELRLTAVSTYLGEDTYYETADARLKRLTDLVIAATKRDPGAVVNFIEDLRTKFFIRGASVAVAVEYLRAGGPNARHAISHACGRPDEPGEVLAYWRNTGGGKTFPWALRRGVADAAVRLYNERAYLKYGQNDRAMFSMADVIELTHPDPKAPWQSTLFKHILDQAHHKDGSTEGLPTLAAHRDLGQRAPESRREILRTNGAETLSNAGYTWEALSGWLPGGMDAEAWEAVIPSMGVMALLRNLRNFDQAGISAEAQRRVEAKITDPAEVAQARVFPYRVWQAYQQAPSDRWKHPLDRTLDLAAGNMPDLSGSVFAIDVSASMMAPVSRKSQTMRYELAALMALAATRNSTDVAIVVFGQDAALVKAVEGSSLLAQVKDIVKLAASGRLGHATYGHSAVQAAFDPQVHTRAIVFTDDQMHDDASLTRHVPQIAYFNLGGYAPHSDWGKRRFHFGGFSDAALALLTEL